MQSFAEAPRKEEIPMSLVEEAVQIWEAHRAGVIAEVENTPEEKLDYRIGEGGRTLREIALHIAEHGVGFVDQILRPDGSLMNLFNPEVVAEIRSRLPQAHTKAEVVALLRQTGEENAARLREAGEALVGQTMPSRSGSQSRLSSLWFAITHESYHRGQLALSERAFGQVPALTRQMEQMRKR
jgi:uncharacterized damage-inducible protein DinB